MALDKLLSRTLKYIFISSCVVALLYPLLNIYFIFPSFTRLLIKDTEFVAEQIARHFSGVVVSFNKMKEPADFQEDAKALSKDFNIENLRVFSESGVIIYSSNSEEIGEINEESYFNEIVKAGKTYSKVVKKGSATAEGRFVEADVVETYVPIMNEGRFVGAIEVYYDITRKNKAITKTVFLYSIIPFAVLFFFLGIVSVILLKADKISGEPLQKDQAINYLSPLYLLLITAMAIFAGETVVMIFLSVLPPLSPIWTAIIDSTALMIIVSPALYFFLLRPLIMHIDARKIMENALIDSEEKYRSLVETTEDSIYLVDRDYRYLFMNNKHISRMALLEEQLLNRKFSDFHSQEESARFAESVDRVFEKGESLQHEHISTRDGQYFLRTLSPVKDQRGNVIAVNVVSKNITELKLVNEKLKASHKQLKELSSHLEEVREKERTHIAREIHDELGQALTVLKMDVSWLSKRLPDEQFIYKLQAMMETLNATLQTVKKISSSLRPSVLDHFGLFAAVEWQAEEFQVRTGIICKIILEPQDVILSRDCSTAVFRILQEALTNVARHAAATNVNISLDQESDRVILMVSDNGIGITKEQIYNHRSFGLMGIRERVQFLKGEFEIHGAPDKGTQLKIVIPVDSKGEY